jgi:hypothetical protein
MTLYQYFGSGSLGTLSALSESKTYTYNISSIFNNLEDYQSITTSPDFTDDFGEIGQVSGLTVDYNLITDIVSGNAQPFGGLTLSGSANTEWVNKNFYGSGEYKVVYSPDNTSGTLFSFGEKIESRTYDYNESSVENTTVDYGLIDNPTIFIEDYQSIVDVSGITEDFNLITDVVSGNIQPFGGLTLSGSALTEPNYRLFFSGQAIVKTSYIPEITYGTLFGFGEKLESITYDYNSSSISENSLDYGLITSPQLGGPDYGFIAESSGTQPDENYGLIIETVQTEVSTPFGLSLFSGSAITSEIATYTKVASGTLTISGSALEAYSAQTPEDTQLFTISGSTLDKDVNSYVGSGILVKFGEKLESITYDYNEESITTNSLDDFGLVSIGSTLSIDCGLIISPIDDGIDNYGLLSGNPFASTPFGSIVISGSTVESFGEGPYTTSGSITIFGDSTTEKFTADTPDNTQLFQISGSALTSDIDVYIGIGTLFKFGEKLESITYDYNESSISDTEDDFGLISDSNSQFSDYGLITGSGGAQPDDDYGLITQVVTTISGYPFGSIFVSGSALEAYSAQIPEDTQLFTISGSALESDTESYVGLGTLTLSGSALESDTESYVGLGTLTLSGSALEAYSAQTPEDTQLFTISGSALEAYSAQTPEDTQLFTLSGTLVEKETDSYVGLGTLTLSGSLVEKETDSYVGLETLTLSGDGLCGKVGFYRGVGIVTVSGSALEAYSLPVPTDTQLFSINGNARTYSPIYPRNSGVVGSATGLIRLNDDAGLTITRATLPYKATGGIFLSGSGLDRFSFANYDGFGTLDLSGIALTREINVYQDYVTTGSIFISQQTQPIIEKIVNTYIGIGTIVEFGSVSNVRFLGSWFASGTINLGKTLTSNYCGTGDQFSSNTNTFDSTISTLDLFCNDSILVTSSAVVESFSAQTPENTQLFSISGSALEAYSAQTPEDLILYQFNGNLQESRTYGYDGSGVVATISSQAGLKFLPGILGVGLFKFTTHLSDNLYDTCDSNVLTSDYQDSALVRFTANLLGSTQLFNVLGSANTQEINVYTQVGIGNVTLSGSLVERQTDSYLGTGTLYALSAGGKIEVDSYNGTGSLFGISGSSQSKSTQTPENALLITVSGTALTKLESEYSYSGISSVYVSGSASTRFEADYPYSGIGTITLSGQVVHPDIQFIPAPKGSGLFTFSGTSPNNTSRIGVLSGNKTLFAFSGGFESFSKVTYIGLGTVYIESTVGVAINNPFQIPRTYVVII